MHHERLHIIWMIVGKTTTINAPLTVPFNGGGGFKGGAFGGGAPVGGLGGKYPMRLCYVLRDLPTIATKLRRSQALLQANGSSDTQLQLAIRPKLAAYSVQSLLHICLFRPTMARHATSNTFGCHECL